MKRVLIVLPIFALLVSASQVVLADMIPDPPLVFQVGVFYSDNSSDPIFNYSNVDSGARVYAMMRTFPGIDETQIKSVKFKHWGPHGEAEYEIYPFPCKENWPTAGYAERMWLLPLTIASWQWGDWECTVEAKDGRKEVRSFTVGFSAFPTPPTNVSYDRTSTGETYMEWNALGPPQSVDPNSVAEYRVEFYGPEAEHHCTPQVGFSSTYHPSMFLYDPSRNRIRLLVPPDYNGIPLTDQEIRIHNILHSGGLIRIFYPDGTFRDNEWSRGYLRTWIP